MYISAFSGTPCHGAVDSGAVGSAQRGIAQTGALATGCPGHICFDANGTVIARGFSGAVMFFVQVYALRSGMLFQGIPLQSVYADIEWVCLGKPLNRRYKFGGHTGSACFFCCAQ